MRRRSFIKTASAGAIGTALFPRILLGSEKKLNVACIGVGGRGRHHIANLLSRNVSIVALADVDESRSKETQERFSDLPFYRDFRDMLSKHKGEIDAVTIATPDHTHHFVAKTCMKEGLPVYLEKPLAHSIREVRDLMQMERETGLPCQMGNQGHSSYGPFLAKEIMRAGLVGNIAEVHAWTTHNNYNPVDNPAEVQTVPESLDWDLWLGPATCAGYSNAYLPGKWRNWNRFGEGALGDMGTHCMDVPYHALDLMYPEAVIPAFSEPVFKESFSRSIKITYQFPGNAERGPVSLTWYHGPDFEPPRPKDLAENKKFGGEHGGSYMVGSKETLIAGGTGTPVRIIPLERHKVLAPKLQALMKQNQVKARENDGHYQTYVGDHMQNWLNAVRGIGKCNSSFAYGGRLTQVALLGNVAVSVNSALQIDPRNGKILNHPEAAELAQGPEPRKGWEC